MFEFLLSRSLFIALATAASQPPPPPELFPPHLMPEPTSSCSELPTPRPKRGPRQSTAHIKQGIKEMAEYALPLKPEEEECFT